VVTDIVDTHFEQARCRFGRYIHHIRTKSTTGRMDREMREEPDCHHATHGHGDHFFGVSTIRQRFPNARFAAPRDVINVMRHQASSAVFESFWNSRFSCANRRGRRKGSRYWCCALFRCLHTSPPKRRRSAAAPPGTTEQRVRFHHPLNVRQRDAKCRLQSWQFHVYNCSVNERHARTQNGRGQNP